MVRRRRFRVWGEIVHAGTLSENGGVVIGYGEAHAEEHDPVFLRRTHFGFGLVHAKDDEECLCFVFCNKRSEMRQKTKRVDLFLLLLHVLIC